MAKQPGAAKSLRVTKVSIKNILGITELEIQPGSFTEISGGNGAGKSSALEAIRACLSGGHDATLIRKGAERGEVVIELEDGTEISKTIKPGDSVLKVRPQGGKLSGKPASELAALIDALSVNPCEFLTMKGKARADALLEVMPIEVSLGRLSDILGVEDVGDLPGAGLALIDAARRQVFEQRTGVNRAIKEKDGTIKQLADAIPPAAEAEGDVEGLTKELADLDAEKDAELQRIANKLAGIEAEKQAEIDKIRDEAQAEIDRIKAKAQADRDAVLASLETMRTAAAKQRELTINKHATARGEKAVKLAALQQAGAQAAKAAQARETVAKMRAELRELETESQHCTDVIEALDKYRLELLAGLPIKGLEIRDGEIYRDGVPFDRLNSAQQVQIAVEIAKLRAGKVGIICVDGIERLDADAYGHFKEAAAGSGLQLVVTRVGEGPIAVESVEG